MDKTTGTTFHSQPVSPSNSQTTTDSEPLIAPEQLSQKLKDLKSVQFLTTSTSTTTLPEKEREPIKKLRPELSTLLTCYIKQTRSIVKSAHHIEILQTAVLNRDPPQGLRPKINPRIPDNKQIDFIIEWEEVTNTAALNYTKLLLKHWEFTSNTAKENINNLEARITSLNASKEEWTYIKEVINKIEGQTREDMERKIQPRNQRINQMEEDLPYPGTSQTMTTQPPSLQQQQPRYLHEQLPQRNKEDLRGRITRL